MKNFAISLAIAILISMLLAVCNHDRSAELHNRLRLLNLKTQKPNWAAQDMQADSTILFRPLVETDSLARIDERILIYSRP